MKYQYARRLALDLEGFSDTIHASTDDNTYCGYEFNRNWFGIDDATDKDINCPLCLRMIDQGFRYSLKYGWMDKKAIIYDILTNRTFKSTVLDSGTNNRHPVRPDKARMILDAENHVMCRKLGIEHRRISAADVHSDRADVILDQFIKYWNMHG